MSLFKLSSIKNRYSLNNMLKTNKKINLKNIKLLTTRKFYHNKEYNRYDIKTYGFYKYIPEEERKKTLNVKFGTIIFFKDFPLFDTLNGDNKISFKNHYFVVVGVDKKKKKIYLSYITTKIDRYIKHKKRNNNYLRIRDINKNKDILISSRKIYEISEGFLYNELEKNFSLINKELKPEIKFYLKNIIKHSEHLSRNFKIFKNKHLKIYKNRINYSLKTDLNDRTELDKEKISKRIQARQGIELIYNY